MGKPTGFMEIERKEAALRPIDERILDFDPLFLPEDAEELQLQGARCMDCGVSFCQAAEQLMGTSIGCPLGNPIPETNDLIYRGLWDEAYKRLTRTHPFPEITGRVCPALCEGSCVEGSISKPVAIKDIERNVADYGLASGLLKAQPTATKTGKRVAIVGSGPSGLACASSLAQRGHSVTVFEKADRPGGFLMYGIPNMKLEKSVLTRRIELLKQQDIEFILNCEVGSDIDPSALREDFDAVVLCIGAREARSLTLAGSDVAGVYSAVDYLTASTKCVLEGCLPVESLWAEDKHVIVIGGGDTGTDCIATALRQRASGITALEILPRLPEKRAENNPWPLWPRVCKTDYGHAEAYKVFGNDVREYETTVKEILTEEKKIVGLVSVKVTWKPNDRGALVPCEIPGTEMTRKADLVLLAMGFGGVEPALPTRMNLELTSRKTIATEAPAGLSQEAFATSLPGVFVAGDARRGPSLVVWALREGMKAAECCNTYLFT